MLKINLADSIKHKLKNLAIGSLQAKVVVKPSDPELIQLLENACAAFNKKYTIQDIARLRPIADARKAYKLLGKDPARYRLSSEALLRRIMKDKGIYKINNIVEINNLVSITSFYSICAFDISKLKPPVQFTIGTREDEYYGIGRGKLNIENLPVFEDLEGKFGSPTSDSERVKITPETEYLSMNMISFSGTNELEVYLNLLQDYLVRYADAENLVMKIFD
ncbi:MAG: phenylalanine--tRNA ligase beta subunit-related protein [Bacteroidales bacterium]|jgi:DNA/RNA-binding domain of Phe-tRNA-synthetase-like protein|nr:phenylalanine--tRNA ligase beta subunit-related protein [Bacteroidales bacterium]